MQKEKFWLFLAACGAGVLFLILTWRITGDSDRITTDAVFYTVILLLLWRKRDSLQVGSGVAATVAGLALVAWVLFKNVRLFWFESSFLKLGPLFLLAGLGLLASGFRGLRRYWLEMLVLLLMVLPAVYVEPPIEAHLPVALATTKTAAFLLHYIGFEVSLQGTTLALAAGAVTVAGYCTGVPMLLFLLKLSLLADIALPLNWWQRIWLPLAAVGIGFATASVRVAVMAMAVSDPAWFDYWHGPQGAQIFSTVAILGFGLVCHLAQQAERQHEGTGSTVSARPQRIRLLALVSGAVWLVTLYALLNPATGRREVGAYNFPDLAPLTGWQPTTTQALNDSRKDRTRAFEIVPSGQHYAYAKDGLELAAELRYVIGASGNIGASLRNQTDIPEHVLQRAEFRHRPGSGDYVLFVHRDRVYLSACINPRGGSTVTEGQFLHNRNAHDLRPARLWLWFTGRESLRDRRCLWTLLSVPLNGQEPPAVYPLLETAWAEWQPWWLRRFPCY